MPQQRGERRAAYAQLADRLRRAIHDGEFADGRQLPTEAVLAAEYGLSRQTVRRAYLELVSEGLVERAPGRGTFVAERDPKYVRHFGSVEDLMGFAVDTTIEVLEPLRRGVDIAAAARLGLNDDIVFSVTYLRAHFGIPFAVTTVTLPPLVADSMADLPELTTPHASGPLTVIGLIEGRLGRTISRAEQTITAVAAGPSHGAVLDCAEGRPLLRIDRLFLGDDDLPVELSVGHFLPEQYTYRISLGRSVQ
jgi:DNA-binding GntR family transcriptional regulator